MIIILFQHPITRFIAKHFTKSYQQEYEMMIHFLYEEEYKQKLRSVFPLIPIFRFKFSNFIPKKNTA